ncbi:MAG: hypothetical protein GX872_02565 [Firmicutes bacterium]|nr:hypothetical protein [Bacillota bacterium]HXL03227.1 SpoIVB peptidase S55 domain-containing protein [Bacillota bacterium]
MTSVSRIKNTGKKTFVAVAVTIALGLLLTGIGAFPYSGAGAQEDPEFMPISQVVPGMKGVSKTVIRGTKIDTFDIEVLGILKGGATTGDLILVRASGDAIEATGGVAAGMSGSPVYINGRLIGAITHSLSDGSDPYLALVTPIGDILRVLEAQQGYHVGARQLDASVVVSEELKELIGKEPGKPLEMTPVKSPVMISGLGGRAFQFLADGLKNYGLQPIAMGIAQSASTGNPALPEPGSAIGVQLIRGDVSATVLGTVTYRKGDLVIAFGHDVLLKGDAGYIATGAEVHHVVTSILKPYKIGSPLDVVGKVTQDRSKGVLVRLDETPKTIPVALTVRDKDTGRVEMFRADIIDDELLMGKLVWSFVLECLDSTIDRIGQGTGRVKFEIHTENLEKPISRENMFFSPVDISAISGVELLDILFALVDNEFAKASVTGIKADVEVEERRQTARIVQAEASKAIVSPGETCEIKVRLHPYRGVPEVKGINVRIPDYTSTGNLYLTVRGGGVAPLEDEEEREDGKAAQRSPAESLEKLISDMTTVEKNNDIVVEFYPGRRGEIDETSLIDEGVLEDDKFPLGLEFEIEAEIPPRAEEKPSRVEDSEKAKEDQTDLVKVILPTGYVIEGETDLELTVQN